MAYYRSGRCAARYGTDRIRALTVNEGGRTGAGRRRLANLKRVTEEAGGRGRFWFGSLLDVASDDVLSAPIWQVAGSTQPAQLVAD